jgi:hypothetical protein
LPSGRMENERTPLNRLNGNPPTQTFHLTLQERFHYFGGCIDEGGRFVRDHCRCS